MAKRRKNPPLSVKRVPKSRAHVKITQREDGRYRIRWVDSAGHSGEKTRRSLHDAEAELDTIWHRLANGQVANDPASFATLGAAAMARTHPHWATWGDASYANVEGVWRNIIAPLIGGIPANELDQSDLITVFEWLQHHGYQQSTFSKVRNVLNHVCAQGTAAGIWATHKNPMLNLPAGVTKSRTGGSDDPSFDLDKTPTSSEVARWIAAAWEIDPRIGFIVTLAARCGLRFSEIVHLTPEHFDWAEGNNISQLSISKAKTRAGVRPVPIGPKTEALIKPLVEGTKPSAFICATRHGNPLARSNAQVPLKRARMIAQIPDSRGSVHYLRHYFAWDLISNKRAPIPDVSRVLGHANPQVTLSIYATANQAEAFRSVARFAE